MLRLCVRLVFGLSLVALPGCDRPDVELARVRGTVTFHGLPALAEVLFEPIAGKQPAGRPSTAFTDADGRFELAYNPSHNGAVIGRHRVSIKVFRTSQTSRTRTSADPLKIVYLKRNVVPGKNNFHFAISY